jgi:hypothetical protein
MDPSRLLASQTDDTARPARWRRALVVPPSVAVVYFLAACVQELPVAAIQLSLAQDFGDLSPARRSAYYVITFIPWTLKPVYGLVSDLLPVAGYHRRPYLVFAFLCAAASYVMMALYVGGSYSRQLAAALIASTSLAVVEVQLDVTVVSLTAHALNAVGGGGGGGVDKNARSKNSSTPAADGGSDDGAAAGDRTGRAAAQSRDSVSLNNDGAVSTIGNTKDDAISRGDDTDDALPGGGDDVAVVVVVHGAGDSGGGEGDTFRKYDDDDGDGVDGDDDGDDKQDEGAHASAMHMQARLQSGCIAVKSLGSVFATALSILVGGAKNRVNVSFTSSRSLACARTSQSQLTTACTNIAKPRTAVVSLAACFSFIISRLLLTIVFTISSTHDTLVAEVFRSPHRRVVCGVFSANRRRHDTARCRAA